MKAFVLRAKEDGIFDRTNYKKGQYCGSGPRGQQATEDLYKAFVVTTHLENMDIFHRQWEFGGFNWFFDFVPVEYKVQMIAEKTIRLL